MALAASLRSSALLLRGFSRGGGLTGAVQKTRRNTQRLGVARWCPPLSGAADMRLRPFCRSLFVSCTQAAAKSPLLTPRRSSAAGAPRSCAEEALGWVFSRARRTANLGRLARGHSHAALRGRVPGGRGAVAPRDDTAVTGALGCAAGPRVRVAPSIPHCLPPSAGTAVSRGLPKGSRPASAARKHLGPGELVPGSLPTASNAQRGGHVPEAEAAECKLHVGE